MISKLRFSLIAVIMLVLVGFGFQNQANGQVGLDGLFCPAVPDTTGWLETEITGVPAGARTPDFTASLIGTVENSGADAVGGLDWQHVDDTFSATTAPTNETGSQLVTWWTQEDGRNTYLQVTNSDGGPDNVTVHVRIFNEDCVEIRDFCDVYTPFDTHEYNFGDLVSNGGASIADGNLQGVEGWLVVTAVTDDCGGPQERAFDHNYLSGQLIVHDSDDYLYGVNTYARQAICFTDEISVPVNRVANGSFQNGEANWDEQEEFAEVISGQEIDPAQAAPPNPYDSTNMAMVIAFSGGSGTSYNGGSFNNISDSTLVNVGVGDDDVAIWESALFSRNSGDSNTLSYNLQMYTGENPLIGGVCANYVAVLLIEDNGAGNGDIIDATCYQENGTRALGNISSNNNGSKTCIELSDSDDDIAFRDFEFDGRSGFQIGETLTFLGTTGQYRIQVVAGLTESGTDNCQGGNDDTGALVNNFEVMGTDTLFSVCEGPLDGRFNARLDVIRPSVLSGQFNILPGNTEAGADVVHINFADDYGPPYEPLAARSTVFVSIFDENEIDQSCGSTDVCFVRLGIDDALVNSDNFSPATPTPPPTTTPPTLIPTTPPPTLIPTPTPNGGGGSGSCAIAGSPVQLGTALANVLIPLVPVAFAFGVRAARRRKK